MCGRYRLKEIDQVNAVVQEVFGFKIPIERPRFNVSPSQTLPVVASGEAGPRAAEMRWGLVPFWEKSAKPKIAPINARSEEALTKPMFRQSLQRRRCAIPADGFYEWRRISDDVKIPFAIQLRGGEPFWFAGMFEEATEVRPQTYALLTTGPNEVMEPIHNRMPVILDRASVTHWLEAGEMSTERFREFTRPYPAAQMEAYEVSRLVNNPRNDRPECSMPVSVLGDLEQAGGPNSA